MLAFLRSRVESTFAIAEKHLAGRPFVLGERPTIVDFSLAGYVYYPAAETGFDIAAEYPAIDAWRRRMADRGNSRLGETYQRKSAVVEERAVTLRNLLSSLGQLDGEETPE